MQGTGEQVAYAVERPAMAFSRPGPGTTRHVPMRPVVRASRRPCMSRLLMAGVIDLDLILGVVERIERPVEVHAGETKDDVHAVLQY